MLTVLFLIPSLAVLHLQFYFIAFLIFSLSLPLTCLSSFQVFFHRVFPPLLPNSLNELQKILPCFLLSPSSAHLLCFNARLF